jgi:hypothetical protein
MQQRGEADRRRLSCFIWKWPSRASVSGSKWTEAVR